ncbi:transporter substrate-binding domain-containing protein [Cytobacillus spongiae]|jgi:polar amino acid transport system substrate-binding protein|uniref:transporter substrate-binding domain-containing protein n=1 Tax=Cytobacillus spongiae TaxID=2901381 RepID=UPI001F178B4B|nr:transporter substrate-binding domain-containing protein [Cytobacillus spongiae]UII54766.1 transporter substrate-binding domain-containing protein [Cytobacillus spongiae]
MKKISSIIIMSLLVFGVLVACGTSEESKKTNGESKEVLVLGTSADYPPFEYVDTAKSEEIIGFDIDLANAIADELGYEVQVKDIDFSGLIPALETGQVDFVLSGMTPTEERKQNVDFSDIYYTAHHMIVSKKESGIKTVEDLDGKTVGVQLASIQEGKAEEMAEQINIKIENRNRIPELIQEIKSGRFDAAIIEDTVAKGYFKNNEDIEGFILEGDDEEAGSAIAFPKESKLTDEFNRVLNELKENGELEKLIVKWFGGE